MGVRLFEDSLLGLVEWETNGVNHTHVNLYTHAGRAQNPQDSGSLLGKRYMLGAVRCTESDSWVLLSWAKSRTDSKLHDLTRAKAMGAKQTRSH